MIRPRIGVRPRRWTASCGVFDRGLGVADREQIGAQIPQGRVEIKREG